MNDWNLYREMANGLERRSWACGKDQAALAVCLIQASTAMHAMCDERDSLLEQLDRAALRLQRSMEPV